MTAHTPITEQELEEMKARQTRALEDVKGFYPQYSPVFIDALHDLKHCIAEIERLQAEYDYLVECVEDAIQSLEFEEMSIAKEQLRETLPERS